MSTESSYLSIKFKMKRDGVWSDIPLEESKDMTLAEIVKKYEGQECVFEMSRDEAGQKTILGYVCGTQPWLDHYRDKGFKVKTFSELLDWQHPGTQAVLPVAAVVDTFGAGCELEQIKLF